MYTRDRARKEAWSSFYEQKREVESILSVLDTGMDVSHRYSALT